MEMSGCDIYSGKGKMCIVRGGGALPASVGVASELALFWLPPCRSTGAAALSVAQVTVWYSVDQPSAPQNFGRGGKYLGLILFPHISHHCSLSLLAGSDPDGESAGTVSHSSG